jgi:hypothetical protein
MRAALASLNADTWRLSDSFAANGAVIADGLDARIDSLWTHFLHGTFGLCVANPSSEFEIARKEVLQEKLIALTDNGAKLRFTPDDVRQLAPLIADYAAATMPFSPFDYPLSSRKRLVDDLVSRIKAAQ